MKYLATVSYDGTNYYGFQRLNDLPTIQKELEKAVSIINKKDTLVKGAGRTDKNVHALGQRATFELDYDLKLNKLKKALNNLLPQDIYITKIEKVNSDFHPRFMVKEKTYTYKINSGKYNPLLSNYTYYFDYKLDIKKIKKVAKNFIGIHHFDNFVSGERENYEAIIYKIKVTKEKDIISITLVGKSFYRYMVRNIIGAILDVLKGKVKEKDIIEMLDNYNVKKTLSCAPACGLYLIKIRY